MQRVNYGCTNTAVNRRLAGSGQRTLFTSVYRSQTDARQGRPDH